MYKYTKYTIFDNKKKLINKMRLCVLLNFKRTEYVKIKYLENLFCLIIIIKKKNFKR